MNILKLNVKTYMLVFLSAILLVGLGIHFSTGALVHIILTPIIAVAAEFAAAKIRKSKPILDEAAITGLILAVLIAPSIVFSIAAPLIAIFFKHIIRHKNINVFNPAALAALILSLFGAGIAWWAASPLIIPLGIFIAYKIGRLRMSFTFLIVFIALNMLAFPSSANILSAAEPVTWFFAFFMLLEPKTSPFPSKAQHIFGAGAAVISIILMLTNTYLDIFLVSLVIMNLFKEELNRLQPKVKEVKPKSGYPDLSPLPA